jgi:pyruvate/2-oxoglutarate dehydrogenase complex dihydrolipoamide dehydrogenase (E3) component
LTVDRRGTLHRIVEVGEVRVVRQIWDAIVPGTGSGGKNAAQEPARRGRSVLAVQAGRFGGECLYVACIPSKAMPAAAHAGPSWSDPVTPRDDLTDRQVTRATNPS